MQRIKVIVIGLAVLCVLIGLAGFFIAPPLIKPMLAEKLSQALKRPVSIQAISINPYLLAVTIRGFEIREPSGAEKFVSFDELYVNLDSFSVFKKALILTEIRLKQPYVRIIRNPDATYNFADLLVKPAEQKEPAEKTQPFKFSLNNIHVEAGSVDFQDGPNKTSHTIRDLRIAVPFISNIDYMVDRQTLPVLSANINGNPYLLKGQTKPFHESMETVLDIDIRDLNIPHYLAYVPVKMNFKLPSGVIDAKLSLHFRRMSAKMQSFSIRGDVGLKRFALDDLKGQPILRLPALNIGITNIEPLANIIKLGTVAFASPELNIRRDKQGRINLLALIPGDNKKKEKPSRPQAKPDKQDASFMVDVGEFRIESGKITFRDDQPSDPVSLALNDLNLKVKDFTTKRDGKSDLDLSMAVGRSGQIKASGPFSITPLSADLALKLGRIDIRTFQGYFTDKIKIDVTAGAITADGKVAVRDSREKGLSATYDGNCLISNFQTVDKDDADDFLSWKSLSLNGISAGNNPLSVGIRRVALADFFADISIDENGVMNLQKIFAAPPPEASQPAAAGKANEQPKGTEAGSPAAAPAKGPDRTIRIDAVTLQGGTVEFTDFSVKPNFSADLSEIGGRVSGLSSIGEKPADVELRAKYKGYMPAEITGKIHPLKEDLFVDIKSSFKDMDLSSATPYSGKYIGYAIHKGKLSFDLKYLVDKKKLDSDNKIYIDQLTLGEKVESPQATKLPVELAIALLKDRSGQINLDIPVTGSLEDPQFSLGRLIVQVIVNLITKAVMAPFALIGGLVGGGEELGYIEFEYGQASLSETNVKKIVTLAKALHERPALKLDMAGHVDMENDREGLKKMAIERKVKTRKFNDLVRQNITVKSVDDVRIEPQEYEKYLREAYREEPFPKPRTAIGLVKTLPVEEMLKLMMTHAVITADDLKRLADRRTTTVRGEFQKSGRVESERIFVVEPKSLAPEKKEKVRDSRVEFKLK